MVDPDRLREELKKMRALIASDERVKARFDTDNNGVIDGDEWEAVRQLVVRRLEREELERQAAREEEAEDDIPVVVGSVASRIFEDDLPTYTGAALPSAASIQDAHDLIVEERGLGSMMPGLFRRNYALLLPDGREVGAIAQREHEWAQQLTNRDAFTLPDLHFDVVDGSTQERYTFRRSAELFDQQIVMFDSSGSQVGYVDESFGVLKPTYRVVSTFQRSHVTVKWHLLHPFSLSILDAVDDRVGEIERGWAGLGAFLTGANRMRIKTDPERVDGAFRFGIIAACVLAEMGQEGRGRNNSVLDLVSDG